MKYTIEDTDTGYRMTMHGVEERIIEEEGGHGLLEELYANASDTWLEARTSQLAEKAGITANKPYPVPCSDCGAPVGTPCIQGCPTYDKV